MAINTVQKAVIDKYAGLTFTGKPSVLWFGAAPLVDASGSAVQLPIVQFTMPGVQSRIDLEGNRIEDWTIAFEIYTTTIEAGQNIAYGVMNNRADPSNRAGFVMADAFSMPSTCQYLACEVDGSGPSTVDLNTINSSITNCYLTRFSLRLVVQRTE